VRRSETVVRLADHYLRVQLSRRLDRSLAGPMMAFVEVTKRCSLRCGTCDIWRVEVGPHDEMTTGELLELARDLGRLGCRYVALFGGEATLRPDLFAVIRELLDVMRLGQERGCGIRLGPRARRGPGQLLQQLGGGRR
jgi:hypothetical protein